MRRARTLLVALALVAASGCGTGPDGQTEVEAGASPAAPEDHSFDDVHEAVVHVHTWATLVAPVLAEQGELGGDVHARAVRVLGTIDLHLRERVGLLAAAAHAAATHDERGAYAAHHRLEEGVGDLAGVVTDVLGRQAGDEFAEHWRVRTHALTSLADAIAASDHAAERRAHEEAEEAADVIADWAEDATTGAVASDDLQHELSLEERHLSEVFEAAADDSEDRYGLLRRALGHARAITEILAEGLAADRRLEGDVRTDAATAYLDLAGALEDHVLLLTSATRVSFSSEDEGPPPGTARALEDATAALVDVTARTVGQHAASELHRLWSEHTTLLFDYADAARRGDDDRQVEIREDLTAWTTEVGELLERATDGALDLATMEREAAGHVDTVVTVIDAQREALDV